MARSAVGSVTLCVRVGRSAFNAMAIADGQRHSHAGGPEEICRALIDSVRTYATEGEIMDSLAEVFGRYVERPVI